MLDDLTVFVRIGLWILAGKLISGGWLPEDVAHLVKSPEMVEAITGLLIGGITAVWYWFSKSHKALRSLKNEEWHQL